MKEVLSIIWELLYTFPVLFRMIVILLVGGVILKLVLFKLFPPILSWLTIIVGKLLSLVFMVLLLPGWFYNMLMRRSGQEPGAFISIIEDLISVIISFFENTAEKIKKFQPETKEYLNLKKFYNAIWIVSSILIILLSLNNQTYNAQWYAFERSIGGQYAPVPKADPAVIKLIAKTDLNIREGPGTQNKVIRGASKGERFDYTNVSQNDNRNLVWYKITTQEGTEGWICSQLVEFEENNAQ